MAYFLPFRSFLLRALGFSDPKTINVRFRKLTTPLWHFDATSASHPNWPLNHQGPTSTVASIIKHLA